MFIVFRGGEGEQLGVFPLGDGVDGLFGGDGLAELVGKGLTEPTSNGLALCEMTTVSTAAPSLSLPS